MSAKGTLIHKDKLGKVLILGDTVCFPDRNQLAFGTIKKLNNKMVTVYESGRNGSWYNGSRKYPHDVIKVEGPEVTMYLLKMNITK